MNFHKLLKIRKLRTLVVTSDLVVQSIGITSALVTLFLDAAIGESIVLILLIQFFLGLWQLGSSLIFSKVNNTTRDDRKKHLKYSSYYLISLFVLSILVGASQSQDGIGSIILIIYLIGPSWMLAIYCYTMTWRLIIPGKVSTSKFLPHINF